MPRDDGALPATATRPLDPATCAPSTPPRAASGSSSARSRKSAEPASSAPFRLRRRRTRARGRRGRGHPYTEQDFVAETKRLTDEGRPVGFDSVGKTTFEKGLDVLAPRGTMALFGQSSGAAALDPQILNAKGSLPDAAVARPRGRARSSWCRPTSSAVETAAPRTRGPPRAACGRGGGAPARWKRATSGRSS